jgi:hypothetical protein
VVFSSDYAFGSCDDTVDAFGIGTSTNVTIWNCTFDDTFSSDILCTSGPTGVLILNCVVGNCYDQTWPGQSGYDYVCIGSTFDYAQTEHVIRLGITSTDERVNIAWCDIDNTSGADKGVRFEGCVYCHVYHNQIFGSRTDIGFDDELTSYVVFDGNELSAHASSNSVMTHGHHASEIMLRCNVFIVDQDYRLCLLALTSDDVENGNPCDTIDVYNNTFLLSDRDHFGNVNSMDNADFVTSNIRHVNNLYVQHPNFEAANKKLLICNSADGITASEYNCYPVWTHDMFALGGVAYTFTEWNALGVSTGEAEEDVAIADVASPNYRPPDTYTTTIAAGRPVDGVFQDYHGNDLDRNDSTWYAGAVGAVPDVVGGVLTLDSYTPTSATLSWTSGTGGISPISEQLQRSPAGEDDWSNVAGATSSPATDTGLVEDTAYDYRVLYTDSADPAGTAYSNTVEVTPTGGPTTRSMREIPPGAGMGFD